MEHEDKQKKGNTMPSHSLLTDVSSTPGNVTVFSINNYGVEAVKDITFGSIAGMVGKVIEYPFDTVKVRLQSQPARFPLRYAGPLDCFRQSLRSEGLPGLYRGISAPLVGAAIETSSLFFSYRVAQDFAKATMHTDTDKNLPLGALIACGAASGSFTSLLLTPIELVKCQMQIPQSSSRQILRPIAVIAAIHRQYGLHGFWHGQLGTLIRETGGSAAWFGCYEGISMIFRKYNTVSSDSLSIWQQLLAGASAGVCYNFIFYPADTIKSRMQTEQVDPLLGGQRGTFLTMGKALWQQQGLRGMYRGCGITVARAAPSSAFIFTVYEGLRSRFDSAAV